MNRSAGTSLPLGTILRSVARRGFPELPPRNLSIEFGECGALMRCDPERGRFAIRVSHELRGAPRRVLEGGIAHELAHILRDRGMSPGRLERALERYASSPACRARDERETDLCAIRRGYGEHLLAFLSHARGLGYTFGREHGMAVGEIGLARAAAIRQAASSGITSSSMRLPSERSARWRS